MAVSVVIQFSIPMSLFHLLARSRSAGFPILEILSRCGDIRDQIRKLCKIAPHFTCFWPQNFLGSSPPQFLNLRYKIGADTDHVAKFHFNRPTELGDLVAK